MLCASCDSNYNKAVGLATEAAKEHFQVSDNYFVEETLLDSVFSPEEDTAVIDKAQILVSLNEMYDQVTKMQQSSQSDEESEQYAILLDSILNTAINFTIDYQMLLDKPREFVGYRVTQKYCCHQDGTDHDGTVIVYLDKKLTRATRVYNKDVWDATMRSIASSIAESKAMEQQITQANKVQ